MCARFAIKEVQTHPNEDRRPRPSYRDLQPSLYGEAPRKRERPLRIFGQGREEANKDRSWGGEASLKAIGPGKGDVVESDQVGGATHRCRAIKGLSKMPGWEGGGIAGGVGRRLFSKMFCATVTGCDKVVVSLIITNVLTQLLSPSSFKVITVTAIVVSFFTVFASVKLSPTVVRGGALARSSLAGVCSFAF